jgi:OmpA-OmpF porin, OOP family
MSNNQTETRSDNRSASYLWWSRIIAIVLAILLALMWLMGYGPWGSKSANCCGAATAAPVVAAPVAVAVAAAGAASLSFDNGKVTIKGEVGTDAEKAKLLADAATAYGAGNVIDAVTVKAGLGALGGVTLLGQVPSEAKKLADGDAATKLFAPAKVDNQLTVAAMAKADDGCAAALKANVGFATGSSQLSAEGKKALDAMAGCLKNGGTVVGHTDNVGNPASNQALSERRAKTASAYLTAKGASNVVAKGVGDTMPAADNATAEGRAKNRRMDIAAQ